MFKSLLCWYMYKSILFCPLPHVQSFKTKSHIRTAQVKVLFVLCYYIVFGVCVLSAYTEFSRTFARFVDELLAYFDCESAGTGEPCDRSGYLDATNPVLSTASFVLLGLVPVVNLVFVVKFQKVMKICKVWCGCKQKGRNSITTKETDFKGNHIT